MLIDKFEHLNGQKKETAEKILTLLDGYNSNNAKFILSVVKDAIDRYAKIDFNPNKDAQKL